MELPFQFLYPHLDRSLEQSENVWWCFHCGTIKHTPCGAITQRPPVFLSVTTEEGLQYLVPFTRTVDVMQPDLD